MSPMRASGSVALNCCRRWTVDVDYSRQTLNLDEFGIPIATGVTPPFNLYHFRLAGSQALVNLAAMSRVRSASDSAVAARFDAQSTGSTAAALAGVAYVRVLGIRRDDSCA
jgi:hypothetical protein